VVSIGVNDIRFNQNETNPYYHQTVSANDVISDRVKNPQADALKQALASTSTGSSRASPSQGSSSGSSDSTGTADSKK
jgi:SH3 domain-containing YSC84-like protein 1